MKFRKYLPLLLFIALILLVHSDAFAQCSMCRTSAESDLKNQKGSIARGLNTGILYLMAVPYLILMTGGYFFFKKPIDSRIKAWKEKRFPSKKVSA